MPVTFQVSLLLIINSIVFSTVVGSLVMWYTSMTTQTHLNILQTILQVLLPHLFFIGSLLITNGNYYYYKIKTDNEVYGISLIIGLFGRSIIDSVYRNGKNIDLIPMILKIGFRLIPFIPQDTKDKIINDIDSSKIKGESNNSIEKK